MIHNLKSLWKHLKNLFPKPPKHDNPRFFTWAITEEDKKEVEERLGIITLDKRINRLET